MDFITAIRAGLYRALDFDGRARRSEFWRFLLFSFFCVLTAVSLDEMLGTPSLEIFPENGFPEDLKQSLFFVFGASNQMIVTVVELILFIPLFSQLVRRLHDIGWSGHWAVGYYAIQFISGPAISDMVALAEADTMERATGTMAAIAAVNLAAFFLWFYVVTKNSSKGPNHYGASPKG